jgi:glutathione peroxidase
MPLAFAPRARRVAAPLLCALALGCGAADATPAATPSAPSTPSSPSTPSKSAGAAVTTAAPQSLPLVALSGQPLDNKLLEGKVVLFVNVASQCGFTGQYKGLQKLSEDYAARGLVVVGVPCNQFGAQEPGKPEEIASFCQMNYGVTFPLLEKQEVNGGGRSALYAALVSSPAGGGKDIGWNFEKFLVGRDGKVVGRYPSRVAPDAAELKTAIEAALGA